MSETLSRIQSDWSTRKIQNVVSDKTAISEQVSTFSPSINFTASTIAPAEKTEQVQYVFQRPKLEPAQETIERPETVAIQNFLDETESVAASDASPEIKKAYLRVVLDLHLLAEEVSGSILADKSRQIREGSDDLEQLQLKKTAEIQKHVLEMEKDATWSFLSNAMQYFLSSSTIVLGGVLVGTGAGAVAGAFLIAAGGLSLIDQIAKDTGAYVAIASHFTKSKEMQTKIASWISTASLSVSLGLGIAGGSLNAFLPGIDAARSSLTAISVCKKAEMAIGLTTAGVGLGKSYSDNEIAKIQKSLQFIEGQIVMMKDNLRRNGAAAKDTIQMMQSISAQAKQAVNAFH